MRNIRLFENYSDFLAIQEAVSGSGKYVEDIFPGFAYTRDMWSGETYAYYNGHEKEQGDYHFGDVVYLASDGKLKSVYWSEYNESMGEKVGLIVVPTSHAADGNARMIAFENARQVANASQPTSVLGASEEYFFENQSNWYGDILANGVLCWDVPPSNQAIGAGTDNDSYLYYVNGYLTGGTYYPQYLSSDYARSQENPMSPSEGYALFQDGPKASQPSKNSKLLGTGTMDTSGQYYDNSIYLGVSPYLEDGTQNPKYVELDWVANTSPVYNSVEPATRGGDVLLGEADPYVKNAFGDWNGYANTYKLQSWGEDAAYVATQYNTPGTSIGDWYVGAMGEMGYVAARAWAISYIMYVLQGDDLFLTYPSHYIGPDVIFTSTEVDTNGSGHEGAVLGICKWQSGIIDNPTAANPEERGDEYPTDIPELQGSDAMMFTTILGTMQNFPATVRPMAMIKEGEIQHAPYTPRPDNGVLDS